MGNIAILAGGDSTLLPREHDVYVGVDGGCLKLLEQGLPLDIAVGISILSLRTEICMNMPKPKQGVQSVLKRTCSLELALASL